MRDTAKFGAETTASEVAEGIDLSGKVALVTGGSSGLGQETARVLAERGAHVIFTARDMPKGEAVAAGIRASTGNQHVEVEELELGSLKQIRAFARRFLARHPTLHILVNNAGVMACPPAKTADGFELQFGSNHLGHFLLTNLLLARLVRNAPARIVIVASGVHDPKFRTGMPKPAVADLATLAATGGPRAGAFDGRLAYVNSKLCNLWFTYELIRRIEAAGLSREGRWVSVNAFEPGLVPGSGLARDYPPVLRFIWDRVLPGLARVLSPAMPSINPVDKAGAALAKVALDPELDRTSGRYFPSHARWRAAPSSDASYDQAQARALWDASVGFARLAPGESPLLTSA